MSVPVAYLGFFQRGGAWRVHGAGSRGRGSEPLVGGLGRSPPEAETILAYSVYSMIPWQCHTVWQWQKMGNCPFF